MLLPLGICPQPIQRPVTVGSSTVYVFVVFLFGLGSKVL